MKKIFRFIFGLNDSSDKVFGFELSKEEIMEIADKRSKELNDQIEKKMNDDLYIWDCVKKSTCPKCGGVLSKLPTHPIFRMRRTDKCFNCGFVYKGDIAYGYGGMG